MIRYIILPLFCSLSLLCIAQQKLPYDLVWTEKIAGSELFDRSGQKLFYEGQLGEYLVFKKTEKNKVELEFRNKSDLKKSENTIIIPLLKNEEYLYTAFIENHIYIITEYTDKKLIVFHVSQFLPNGQLIKKTELCSFELNKDGKHYFSLCNFSSDSKHILIRWGIKKQNISKMMHITFDSSFVENSRFEIDCNFHIVQPVPEKYVLGYDLNNVIMVDLATKTKKSYPLDFCYRMYDVKARKLGENKLQLVGAFVKTKDSGHHGIFKIVISKNGIEEVVSQTIPIEKMAEEGKEIPSNGIGWDYIRSVQVDSTKDIYYFAEDKSSRSGQFYKAGGANMYAASQSFVGTLNIFHFGTNGGLVRHMQLPKGQYTINSQDVYGGIFPIVSKGKLYLLLNDNPKNTGTNFEKPCSSVYGMSAQVFSFSEGKEFERIKLTTETNSSPYLITGICTKISDNEFLIFVLEGGSIRIGKMTF